MAVTATVTTKFSYPTRKRRREWQQAMHEYRDVKQYLIDGWGNRRVRQIHHDR